MKHWINITLMVLLLLIMTIFIVLENIKFNDEENDPLTKKHTGRITIQSVEGMTNPENMNMEDNKHKEMLSKMKKGFCSIHQGNSDNLEKDCNMLSKDTCSMTECCIYAYNKQMPDGKCVAGTKSGPTYHSDENGIDHNFEYYYYMGKKYGGQ